MKTILCILTAVALLCGCGTIEQSMAHKLAKTARLEDYGPPPPTNHVELEEYFVRAGLKDPDSAQIRFTNSVPAPSIIPSGFASPTPRLIWQTFFEVNAKNSYGGYTGFSPYLFAWRDGKMVAYISPGQGFWNYLAP
jgi:hypothetical protein